MLEHMPTIPLDNQESRWLRACDWLESHGMKTYQAVFKSGFGHLKDVKKYSDWTEVVAATADLKGKPMKLPETGSKCIIVNCIFF
jgi:hypothetical protein